MLEQPLLASRIEEVDPDLLFHALELRDQLEPGVQRLDDPHVVVRELLAELADAGVVGGGACMVRVHDHSRAVVVGAEERRRDPHRDPDTAVRRGIRGYGRIAVDREAALEVHRVPEHPVPAADLAIDLPVPSGVLPVAPVETWTTSVTTSGPHVDQHLPRLVDLDVVAAAVRAGHAGVASRRQSHGSTRPVRGSPFTFWNASTASNVSVP